MVVDAELVGGGDEVVRGGDLQHEGGGGGRLRVARDPGVLQTLRNTRPVAEKRKKSWVKNYKRLQDYKIMQRHTSRLMLILLLLFL